MESSMLVRQVRLGERTAYAWGGGYIFEACRAVHGIPLRAVVHTSAALIGTRVNDLPIIAPDELKSLDPDHSLIIGYSSEFRAQIANYVGQLPGMPLIFYDEPCLLASDRITELANGLKFAAQSGLLKPASLRLLRRAIDAPAESEESWGISRELELGYDFYSEHHRARYQALTPHIHFLHQENIAGDIAEFGTGYGTTAAILAAAVADASLAAIAPWAASQARQVRKLHLFDSFEGLPAITNKLDIAAGWKKGLLRDKSAQELRHITERFLESERIVIYAGWFKDTLRLVPAATRFSLIHIDCDIYESTIEVLDHLFTHRHVSNGCAVFFDDWNCGAASPDLGERRAWRETVEKHRINFSDCGGYGTYGNKFLVHFATDASVR